MESIWDAIGLDWDNLVNFPRTANLQCPTTFRVTIGTVIVDENNVDQHRGVIFPTARKLVWKLNYLDSEILANFSNVTEFVCQGKRLTTLKGVEHLAKLEKLVCASNKLTNLQGLENLVHLEELDCSSNDLIDLNELKQLTRLRKLYCKNNQIKSLQGLENCVQLQELYCHQNKLIDLQGLENCVQLQVLYCNHNKLITLQGLENCSLLYDLVCYCNKLTSLQSLINCTLLQDVLCQGNRLVDLRGLENCSQLRELWCCDNQLRNISSIIHLSELTILSIDDDLFALGTLTPEEARFLVLYGYEPNDETIYANKQNVHNTAIQRSVKASVSNLLKDPKPPKPDLSQLRDCSRNLVKLYCADKTPHAILQITYKELFSYVWARIQRSEHKDDMIAILEQELKDSKDMCYVGRFNRTINALCGFYDDIEVQISDPDRINAIIHQHKDKANIIQALQEAGYDVETIEVWTKDL